MSPPSDDTADGATGQSFDPKQYHVSYNTGFMLEDPLTSLPPYFEEWHILAISVPKLLIEKKVREAVSKLPVLDHEKLVGYRQLRLAHLQLSHITSAYVWQNGNEDPPQVLPQCLAVPLYGVSRKLGIQPVLCHTDVALANWKRRDLNGSYEIDNLECLYHLPGGIEGDWFCLVTDMVELKFALCLKPIVSITDLLQKVSDLKENEISKLLEIENQIAIFLQDLEAAVQTMGAVLSRMHENIGAGTFFNVLRPFFTGWGGDGSPLPSGLVYDGISETPMKMHGDTAAQSATLQTLDAFLGVEHTTDKRDFLVLMRKYIPPDHKRFIEDLEQRELPLKLLVQSSNNESMKAAYNKCLSAVVNFRTYHIQLVTKYVVIASKEKTGDSSSQSSELRGTGGSSLLPFLKTLRTDTEKAKTLNRRRERFSWLKLGLVTAVATVVVGVTFKFYSR